jgi:hypothetical protein
MPAVPLFECGHRERNSASRTRSGLAGVALGLGDYGETEVS